MPWESRAYSKRTLGNDVEISLFKYARSVIEVIEIPAGEGEVERQRPLLIATRLR